MTAFDAYNIGKGVGAIACLWGTLLIFCALFSTDEKPPSFWAVHIHMLMIVIAVAILLAGCTT